MLTKDAGAPAQLTERGKKVVDAPRRRVAQAREISSGKSLLLGLLGIVSVLLVWEVASRQGWINPLVLSSPSGIWEGGRDLIEQGVLGPALLSTARLFALGMGISLAGGLLLGVIIGWYPIANAVLDPWVSILYASPRIAFIPLIAVWFGPGLTGQIVIVVLIAIFPVVINVAAGVRAVDRDMFKMARSSLATNRDVLLTVALPGAVPAVASGVRQGVMQGLLGVVVAEYFLGNTGVGGIIFQAGLTLRTGQALLGAFVFAVAALLATSLLKAIEKRLDKWRTS